MLSVILWCSTGKRCRVFAFPATAEYDDGMMTIRGYRPDDLPVLKEITVEAFHGVSIDQGIEREFGAVNGRDWKWRKARHLDDDARREPEGLFVAEEAGRIVGYITTWHDSEAGLGHIPNLAIVPDCRGKGLGRRLIEHALQHFRRLGLTHAKIETLEQNAIGNHLYPSLGFREVARQVHFCADLSSPGDEMTKDVDEHVVGGRVGGRRSGGGGGGARA